MIYQEQKGLIEEFIQSQVISRGLDERTAKAYQLDLELFFRWLESEQKNHECVHSKQDIEQNVEQDMVLQSAINLLKFAREDEFNWEDKFDWEEKMEEYLDYLSGEKRLRFSTIARRHLVFGYYLSYLKAQGIIEDFRPLKPPSLSEQASVETFLTKNEVDAFFRAISQEYTGLDSDFRRRVCLRDQVMMELLFYHRIEISELLRMEVSDYNRKTAVLKIRRKKEKDRSVHLFSQALQERMEQWLSEHEYFEHTELYHNRMFLSKLGKPLSMKMVTNIFDKYRVLAGIEKECSPKDLKNGLGRYAEEVVRGMG